MHGELLLIADNMLCHLKRTVLLWPLIAGQVGVLAAHLYAEELKQSCIVSNLWNMECSMLLVTFYMHGWCLL